MRLVLIIVLSLFLFSTCFCQDEIYSQTKVNSLFFSNTDYFENIDPIYINDTKRVLDSTHQYYLYQDELYLKYRYKILSRNGEGNFTSAIYFVKNTPDLLWQNNYFVSRSYHSSGKKFETLQKVWNNNKNEWIDSSKYDIYNQDGKQIRNFSRNWSDTENKFISGYQTYYYYDPENITISKKSMKWDKELNKWLNNKIYLYKYNDENKKIETLELKWDNDQNTWENYFKEINEYSSNGNKTKVLEQNYEENQWVNSDQIITVFNSENKRINQLYQIWENGGWINESQNYFDYDSNGYEIYSLRQEWDPILNQWQNNSETTRIYNSNKSLIKSTSLTWSQETGEITYGSNHFYTYDSSNKKTQAIHQQWNEELKTWINFTKNDYTYDVYVVENLSQLWDVEDNIWVNHIKISYDYNLNGSPLLTVYKNWNNELSKWINDVKYTNNTFDDKTQSLKHRWEDDQNSWKLISQNDYFWSEFEIVNNINTYFSDLEIFPNPVSNYLYLNGIDICKINNIEIYSINGSLMFDLSYLNQNVIHIPDFSNGLYVLKINTSKGEIVRKFVVNK